MFLDPMAITINVQNDNNTLKVPSISSVDGRMSLRDRLSSDSSYDESTNKYFRSAVSTPSPRIKDMQDQRFARPVSDQQLNVKNRKEKAVSWHSKIPSSTQTLGCVEGVSEKEMGDDKHTQSQPLLGTLESNSSHKHICRHTYSVKQVPTSAKEWNKSWSVRRCASSGNEKSKFREKYLQLRPTNKVEDCSASASHVKAKVVKQPSLSKNDSVDNSKGDEMSLIDWEEDEKLCDEEVGNITGNVEDDDDIRPTISYLKRGSDVGLINVEPRTSESERLRPIITDKNHSRDITNDPSGESFICDSFKSDSANSVNPETTGSPNESIRTNDNDPLFKEPIKQCDTNLLSVPLVNDLQKPKINGSKLGIQLQEGTLLRPLVILADERRPPIQSPLVLPTEERRPPIQSPLVLPTEERRPPIQSPLVLPNEERRPPIPNPRPEFPPVEQLKQVPRQNEKLLVASSPHQPNNITEQRRSSLDSLSRSNDKDELSMIKQELQLRLPPDHSGESHL